MLSLISPDTSGVNALAESAEWLRAGDAEMVLCLAIEAMNRSTANSVSLPENFSPPGWHGAALLLGHVENLRRERPFATGSLVDVCRKLCSAPERAC